MKKSNEIKQQLVTALKFHEAGQLSKAKNIYQKILGKQADNPEALYFLILIYYQLKQPQEALELLYKALANQPNNAELWTVLGNILRDQQKLTEAIAAYKKAINANAKYYEAYYRLGILYHEKKCLTAAANIFRKIIKLDPNEIEAYNFLSFVLREQKKYKKAIEYCEAALTIDPKSTAAYENLCILAYILKSKKSQAVAIELFEKLIKLKPKEKKHYTYLADIYYAQGAIDQAKKLYQKAAKLGSQTASCQLQILNGKLINSIDETRIKNNFNYYAENFEKHLVETLDYRTPQLLHQALISHLGPAVLFKKAVDLGCGTGLVGKFFKKNVDELSGVDLSPKMLAQARSKMIYQHLIKENLLDFLQASNHQYDLVLATDVFVYLGNLASVFAGVRKLLNKGGYFIFSTESTSFYPFFLHAAGRFAHSRRYIKQLAAEHAFQVQVCRSANLRKEYHAWVTGDIFILRNNN